MRTVNKIIMDGELVAYTDGNTQFAPGSEQEAILLQQIADKEAGFGLDDDRTPVLSVDEKRHQAYNAAGVTADKMIVALYEKVVEGKSDAETGIAAMQTKRAAVKAANPKG